MRRVTKKEQRRILRGWIKWAPALAIVFSVLFFDVWLNMRQWSRDYETRRLSQREQELMRELKALRVREAVLEKFDRLTEMAIVLGLKEPEPHQFETIRQNTPRSRSNPFTMARAGIEESQGSAYEFPTMGGGPSLPIEEPAGESQAGATRTEDPRGVASPGTE